jgi:hypothetical protein
MPNPSPLKPAEPLPSKPAGNTGLPQWWSDFGDFSVSEDGSLSMSSLTDAFDQALDQ